MKIIYFSFFVKIIGVAGFSRTYLLYPEKMIRIEQKPYQSVHRTDLEPNVYRSRCQKYFQRRRVLAWLRN